MDLLSQYKQDHPEEFREKPRPVGSADRSQYGFLIRVVMKMSGGLITDANQASYTLLIGAILLIAIAAFFYYKFS